LKAQPPPTQSKVSLGFLSVRLGSNTKPSNVELMGNKKTKEFAFIQTIDFYTSAEINEGKNSKYCW
jgi:hypothetical protein